MLRIRSEFSGCSSETSINGVGGWSNIPAPVSWASASSCQYTRIGRSYVCFMWLRRFQERARADDVTQVALGDRLGRHGGGDVDADDVRVAARCEHRRDVTRVGGMVAVVPAHDVSRDRRRPGLLAAETGHAALARGGK